MGWFDANEYFVMLMTERDRVDDLFSATELAAERAVRADQRMAAEPAYFCSVRGSQLSHLPV